MFTVSAYTRQGQMLSSTFDNVHLANAHLAELQSNKRIVAIALYAADELVLEINR